MDTDEWIKFYLKEFGMGKNMFKQNKKNKKWQKMINELQTKKKEKQKTLWGVVSCRKEWDVYREEKIQKLNLHKNAQKFVLDEWNVTKVHNCASFACRRFFFSFHLKD